MEIHAGDCILLQRTEENTFRVPEFLDNKWVIVSGFNNRHHPYVYLLIDRRGPLAEGSVRRRDFQHADIKAVARRGQNPEGIQQAKEISLERTQT